MRECGDCAYRAGDPCTRELTQDLRVPAERVCVQSIWNGAIPPSPDRLPTETRRLELEHQRNGVRQRVQRLWNLVESLAGCGYDDAVIDQIITPLEHGLASALRRGVGERALPAPSDIDAMRLLAYMPAYRRRLSGQVVNAETIADVHTMNIETLRVFAASPVRSKWLLRNGGVMSELVIECLINREHDPQTFVYVASKREDTGSTIDGKNTSHDAYRIDPTTGDKTRCIQTKTGSARQLRYASGVTTISLGGIIDSTRSQIRGRYGYTNDQLLASYVNHPHPRHVIAEMLIAEQDGDIPPTHSELLDMLTGEVRQRVYGR